MTVKPEGKRKGEYRRQEGDGEGEGEGEGGGEATQAAWKGTWGRLGDDRLIPDGQTPAPGTHTPNNAQSCSVLERSLRIQ